MPGPSHKQELRCLLCASRRGIFLEFTSRKEVTDREVGTESACSVAGVRIRSGRKAASETARGYERLCALFPWFFILFL